MTRRLSQIVRVVRRVSCCSNPSISDEEEQIGQEGIDLRSPRGSSEHLPEGQPLQGTGDRGFDVPPGGARHDPTEDVPAAQARAKEAPTLDPVKYGEFQEAGAQRRRWIDDPDEPDCLIPRSTLTFNDLFESRYSSGHFATSLPVILSDYGLPDGRPAGLFEVAFDAEGACQGFEVCENDEFYWEGFTGPGVIFIDLIARFKEAHPPQISEITQAIYRRDFDVDGLRHIFITSVQNTETKNVVRQIYSKINRPSWPMRSWDIGTPEYDALLGSRLGKLTAYLILGAFPRGSRRIQRIVTARDSRREDAPNLRFDIEVIA
jgi:hypothetical protein